MLGSLIYLYVVFSWYSSGAVAGQWLNAAQFLAPFVAAFAVIGAVSLFFMSIGAIAGKMTNEKMNHTLWKFVMLGAISLVILAAGGALFYAVILGFILTYLGAAITDM